MKKYVCIGYGKRIESSLPLKIPNIKKKLSVIITALNEEENVIPTVNEIKKNVKNTPFEDSYEIIFVEDNSSDKTPEILDKLAKKESLIALHRYGVKEIFSALLDGIEIANGEYIYTTGADLSQPFSTIQNMSKFLGKYDILSGSRYVKGGGMEAPFQRKIGSIVINRGCAIIMGLPLKDLTGANYLMKKEDFKKIKFKYPSRFGEFGFEFFYRAHKQDMTIKEVPFVYKFRVKGESKMKAPYNMVSTYVKRAFKLRFEKS